MTIKGNGRSALILTTGLFVGFACPSLAATGADSTTAAPKSDNVVGLPVALHTNLRPGTHHRTIYAHRKSHRVASQAAEEKAQDKAQEKVQDKADDRKAVASDVAADNRATWSDLPPSIANAYAQLAFPATPGGTIGAMQVRANELLQAASANSPADARVDGKADNKADNETLVVAADQLNDVDRTLHESNAPAANTVVAPAPNAVVASADPPAPPPVTAGSQESSTWDQTSLIGKIFIGFGALLTMASAARMFMA
jgi:hypothetical protein